MFGLLKGFIKKINVRYNNYTSRSLKVFLWSIEHKEEWETICGINRNKINKDEFNRQMQMLIKAKFDEIRIVLITVHFYVIEDDALGLLHKFASKVKQKENDNIQK